MNKINCNVTNCSHNETGVCYSNRVNIVGFGAGKKEGTCCGSFLDKKNYSDLTNNTNGRGACDCLVCKAVECEHNKNELCTLDCIQVTGNLVNLYTETYCDSFKE